MRLMLYAFIVLTFIPVIALAEEKTASTPVFGQKIEFNIPDGWKPAFEQAGSEHYISELIPENNTKEEWTEMFTLQGFKGAAPTLPPAGVLAFTAQMHKDLCKEQMTAEDLGESKISGFKAQSAIIGCASIDKDHPSGLKAGMSEIAYYIAVQGKEDVYVFHKALRGSKYDPKAPPLTKANAQEFINEFMPLKICNKNSKFNECLQ